jgi:hypothetical protein
MSHHPILAPSSMPAILSCACFESRSDGDRDTGAGNEVHRVLAALSNGDIVTETTLDLDLFESCLDIHEQAMTFLSDNAEKASIQVEQRLELKDNVGNVISYGTCDINAPCNAGKHVFILDWKACLDFDADSKDHKEQLMIYALMKMRELGFEKALCVEAFVTVKKLKPYWVTYSECVAMIECAMARRSDPNKIPQANDFCKWCFHIMNCPAVNRRVAVVTELFCDMPRPEKFNALETMTPEEMAVALTFSRATLKKYIKGITAICDGIETAAMAISDNNQEIPGYARVIEAGKKEVIEIDKAFRLSGMSQGDFSPALKLSLPKLAKRFAEMSGLKAGAARKEIEGRLNEVIITGEAKATLERK